MLYFFCISFLFCITGKRKSRRTPARGNKIKYLIVVTIPILSAIFPTIISDAAALPAATPIEREEARLTFLGNKSCSSLVHSGRVEIEKIPESIRNMRLIFTGTRKIA